MVNGSWFQVDVPGKKKKTKKNVVNKILLLIIIQSGINVQSGNCATKCLHSSFPMSIVDLGVSR